MFQLVVSMCLVVMAPSVSLQVFLMEGREWGGSKGKKLKVFRLQTVTWHRRVFQGSPLWLNPCLNPPLLTPSITTTIKNCIERPFSS
jgi:hypothetical protein